MRTLSVVLALGVRLAAGQELRTISVIKGGTAQAATTSTSTPALSTEPTSLLISTSSSLSLSSSFSSPSQSPPPPPSSSSSSFTTSTPTYDPSALTTVFTQPTDCSRGITRIEAWSTELWQNIVTPVPGVTITSCYPEQFYSSIFATALLPPLKQIICPLHWENYLINSTYLICCPSGYGLLAPSYRSTERPGQYAFCTSKVGADVLMDITSYDATALATTLYTSAGPHGDLVVAMAFDGTVATTTASQTPEATTTTSRSTATSKPTSTSTSAPTTTPTSASTKTLAPLFNVVAGLVLHRVVGSFYF